MGRIGIMGGTFDPIHNGHIMLGRQAYEEYDLDCIWYMPSRIPPHKKDHTITAAKDRLAMTAAAIAPYPYFKLSDFELRRTGFCSVAFPKLIARAFTNDPDLLDVTANGLRISLLVFVGSQISISQFFQSIGIAWKAMFLSLSRQVLFLIPAMLLFSRFWGLDGVWYAAPFSDFVAAVTAWLFLWYHVKNMKSKNSD